MARKVLYREWRPQTFDDVVGQEHVVNALRQSVKTGDIAHAYLFSGTRGTGKTSLAKIFARAINCLNPDEQHNPCNACEICRGILDASLLDVLEMDAASNNSVDNIRKITDEVLFLPTLAKYKVYIIDEVHMLSTAAFNALLKTLEEPPAHAIFILATTDPQRIPATILSRCQRFDFKRIAADDMAERLKKISNSQNISITDEAIQLIIQRSEGALRDAISILDQSRSIYSGTIDRDDILQMTGVVNDDLLEALVLALHDGNVDELLRLIDHLIMEGGDLQRFVISLSSFYRDILVCKTARNPANLLMQTKKTLMMMENLAKMYSRTSLIRQINHLTKLQIEMKQSLSPRISLEVGLIEMLNLREISAQDEAKELPYKPSELRTIEKVETPQASSNKADNPTEHMAENPKRLEQVDDSPAEKEADTKDDTDLPNGTTSLQSDSEETHELSEPFGEAPPEIEDVSPYALSFDLDDRVNQAKEPKGIKQDTEAELSPDKQTDVKMSHLNEREKDKGTQAVSEAKEAQNTSDKPTEAPVDSEVLWNDFMKELSETVPLLAIVLNAYPRHIEGKSFIIDIPENERTMYDRIKDAKTWKDLSSAFAEIAPSNQWRLHCRLGGQDISEENRIENQQPEWIRKMKAAAKNLEIPLEEKED